MMLAHFKKREKSQVYVTTLPSLFATNESTTPAEILQEICSCSIAACGIVEAER